MASRRSPKASQGPASPRLVLPEHAPPHVKALADHVERAARTGDETADALRACLDGIAAFFGAVALALQQKNAGLSSNDVWSLRGPLTATGWRLLLADACHALEGSSGRLPRDLVRACADTGWQDIRIDSWPAEPIENAITEWVRAATPFFSRWRLVRDGSATVLRGPGPDLDLFPFLRIDDCPDCDAVASTFLYDGPASPGRIRYRSLQSGHAISAPLPADAPAWMRFDAPTTEPARPQRPLPPADSRSLRLQRALLEGRGGYVVVSGGDRSGKSAVARRLAHDPALARQGFRLLHVTAPRGDATPASLWLQVLDERLRATTATLPPRELVTELQRLDSAEHRTRAWLSAAATLVEGPLVLVVDDVDAWPQSAAAWPLTLPAGVFVVLLATPERLSPELGRRLDQIVDAGATLLSFPDSASAPPAPSAALPVLTRLAAARGTLPLHVLTDMVGRDACHRAAKWIRPTDDGVEAAHPIVTHPDWAAACTSTCAQMAWWARDVMLDPMASTAARETARDGLWRWAREGGLTVRLARDARLCAGLADAARALEVEAPLRALALLTEWVEAWRPLFAQEHPVIDVEPMLEITLRRADLLLRLGSHADAAQAVAAELPRLAERVRTDRPDLGTSLARALLVRAQTALHRNMPTTAVEDCSRALELHALHEVRTQTPADAAETARAHWLLGLALAATGNPEAATLSVKRAAEACATPDVLVDLAALHLQSRRLAEADEACTRALDALQADDLDRRAACLYRRAQVRAQRQQHDHAESDLRASVDLYAALVREGRADVAAAAAQARLELGHALVGADRPAEAREQLEEAARLFRAAIDDQGRRGCRPLLAQVLNENGLVCARLGLTDEAIHLCTLAIELGTLLLEREKRSSIRSELARALNNRARAFASSTHPGSAAAALRDFQQAAAHYEALIHRQRRYAYRHHLALVCYNRGGLHRTQGEPATAAREYRRAVELLAEVRAEHATREVTLDLAAALTHEALVLDPTDALAAYRQAVELLVQIYHSEDERTAAALAAALHGEGRARAALGRGDQASSDLTAALGLYRKLRRADAVAAALVERGRVAMTLRRFDRAAADFEEASSATDAAVRAAALHGLGGALRACSRPAEALAAYDRALAHLGGPAVEVAETLRARARVRLDLDDAEGAMRDVERALQALDDSLPASRARLPLALTNLHARALVHAGRWDEAIRVCSDVDAQLSRLDGEDAEAARLQAESSTVRGRAERGRHRLREAVDAFTRAIAAWSRQADETRDVDMCLELARVYRDRADAQRSLGLSRSAGFDYGWTIDLLAELSTEHAVAGLEPELAAARAARGVLGMREGRLREAVTDLAAALEGGLRKEPLSGLDLQAALQRTQALLEARKPC